MSMVKKQSNLPIRSAMMAWAEFIEVTGITPELLTELVDIGWLRTSGDGRENCLFYEPDVYRVRKLERICCDFELPLVGGTIIIDLLERIDALEQRLRSIDME